MGSTNTCLHTIVLRIHTVMTHNTGSESCSLVGNYRSAMKVHGPAAPPEPVLPHALTRRLLAQPVVIAGGCRFGVWSGLLIGAITYYPELHLVHTAHHRVQPTKPEVAITERCFPTISPKYTVTRTHCENSLL